MLLEEGRGVRIVCGKGDEGSKQQEEPQSHRDGSGAWLALEQYIAFRRGGLPFASAWTYNRRVIGRRLLSLLCLPALIFLLAAGTFAQQVQLRHWSGQAVAPVYEGFDVNPDGSFNMWFGYMNRNFEETPDIPVGPDNRFEPGGDRGQPTHFEIRRHKDVFKVVVPKDFGDQRLVWFLTAHGKTEQVAGSLKPVWMIDRNRTTRGGNSERINSNTPPVVRVDTPEATLNAPGTLTLRISATDDGLPARAGKPVGMSASWAKYRGPGTVRIVPAQSKLTDGHASVIATFDSPGEYVLQVVVDDGSGELAGNFGYHCCWTNAQVKVTVQGGGLENAQR